MYKLIKIHKQIHRLGRKVYYDKLFEETSELTRKETLKRPLRFDIINLIAKKINALTYLEIGVRNPGDNFNKIEVKTKFSVDPGVEYKINPVDFQLTSDSFFKQLAENKLKITNEIKFDIIFIDGLHLANQVEKDINNSLKFLSENGIIVLHDCNPPSEFHARESYNFLNTPAGGIWNGTTWKAFCEARRNNYSCCVDTDWGIGLISKKKRELFTILESNIEIKYFDYLDLSSNRKDVLNLIDANIFFEKFNG